MDLCVGLVSAFGVDWFSLKGLQCTIMDHEHLSPCPFFDSL